MRWKAKATQKKKGGLDASLHSYGQIVCIKIYAKFGCISDGCRAKKVEIDKFHIRAK